MGINFDPIGAAVSIWQTDKQNKQADKNFRLEQDKFNYDKQLQQTLFAREDNAQQRAVADLRAAGLSPTLAAGRGADAGPVVPTTAPQSKREYSVKSPIQANVDLLQFLNLKANSEQAQAANRIAQSNADYTEWENSWYRDRDRPREAYINEQSNITSRTNTRDSNYTATQINEANRVLQEILTGDQLGRGAIEKVITAIPVVGGIGRYFNRVGREKAVQGLDSIMRSNSREITPRIRWDAQRSFIDKYGQDYYDSLKKKKGWK